MRCRWQCYDPSSGEGKTGGDVLAYGSLVIYVRKGDLDHLAKEWLNEQQQQVAKSVVPMWSYPSLSQDEVQLCCFRYSLGSNIPVHVGMDGKLQLTILYVDLGTSYI